MEILITTVIWIGLVSIETLIDFSFQLNVDCHCFIVVLQDEGGGGLGELTQTDLSGLSVGLDEEEEDIFKQLADTSFELEQLFGLGEQKVTLTSVSQYRVQFKKKKIVKIFKN